MPSASVVPRRKAPALAPATVADGALADRPAPAAHSGRIVLVVALALGAAAFAACGGHLASSPDGGEGSDAHGSVELKDAGAYEVDACSACGPDELCVLVTDPDSMGGCYENSGSDSEGSSGSEGSAGSGSGSGEGPSCDGNVNIGDNGCCAWNTFDLLCVARPAACAANVDCKCAPHACATGCDFVYYGGRGGSCAAAGPDAGELVCNCGDDS